MGLCYKEWIVDVSIVDSFLIIIVSLLITGGATYLLAHSKKKVSVAKWQFVCICVAWIAAGILVIVESQELLKIAVLFLAYHIFIFLGNYILMKEKYKISTVIFWEYIGVYVVLFFLFLLIIGEGDGLDFGFGDGEEKKKKKGKGGYNNVNASGSGE